MSRALSYPTRWDFDIDGHYTYPEYRKAVEFEKLTAFAFDRQTRQLVANNDELARAGLQATEITNDQLGSIKESLSSGLSAIDESLHGIHETLGMGLSVIGINTGRMADTLDQLLHSIRNPSLTWSLEQFEISRDEIRRGLFKEALETIQRAINGYGSNAGHKTEFRFHMLLGSLYLGEFENHPVELINPQEAQRSFEYAAKLAAQDFPSEALKASMLAARAAYLAKDIAAAIRIATAALTFAERPYFGSIASADLMYLQAKLESCTFSSGAQNADFVMVSQKLKSCFIFSYAYALCAAADNDLMKISSIVRATIQNAANEITGQNDVMRARLEIDREKFIKILGESIALGGSSSSVLSSKFDEGLIGEANDIYLGKHTDEKANPTLRYAHEQRDILNQAKASLEKLTKNIGKIEDSIKSKINQKNENLKLRRSFSYIFKSNLKIYAWLAPLFIWLYVVNSMDGFSKVVDNISFSMVTIAVPGINWLIVLGMWVSATDGSSVYFGSGFIFSILAYFAYCAMLKISRL